MAEARKDNSVELLTQRARIIGQWERGASTGDIARDVGVSVRTVQRWISRWQEERSIANKARKGRPRTTTPEQDACIVAASVNHPNKTAVHITHELQLLCNPETTRRRLRASGISCYVSAYKESLKQEDKEDHLGFGLQTLGADVDSWKRVILMNNESYFKSVEPQATHCWRQIGTRIGNELSYVKAGYRADKWKWVLSLPQNKSQQQLTVSTQNSNQCQDNQAVLNDSCSKTTDDDAPPESSTHQTNISSSTTTFSSRETFTEVDLTKEYIFKSFGLDKPPKSLPCQKRCTGNPWCISELKSGSNKGKVHPTDQPRDPGKPVGLQNTANTCWINSALQALFHLPKFRNAINTGGGFQGDESLSCMLYLMQAMFVEMDTHAYKAVACSPGSVFEKMGLFVSQEIMRKDADHEVLKCVSEFLENTIDTLIADPQLGSDISSLFSTSLMRVARWKCSTCGTEHETQVAPATSYTMAAYVSADECPLDQCLVDLQAETQTGVSLVCGSEISGQGGCGAKVKVDRVVTPKIQALPTILVIRNNSLIDRDLKRRLHVVYPEILDLTAHTLNHVAASYTLSAVIYHHGHWVKHFSAHVKTNGGKWYNFNDEHVSELTNRTTNGTPPESHRNYFSVANVATKYKHRPGLRVSRGAFIWVYVRSEAAEGGSTIIPPPESVVEYVLKKQEENLSVNYQLQAEIKREREGLLSQLAVSDLSEEYYLMSEPLLTAWFNSDDIEYIPQPRSLAHPLCEHKLFSPRKFYMLKCVKAEAVKSLLSERCGIHQDEALKNLGLPLFLSPDTGCCKQCMVKAVKYILFIEQLKTLHKLAKKEARREHDGPTQILGLETLENWPRLSLAAYIKENGLDGDEEETEAGDINTKSEECGRGDTKVDTNSGEGTSNVHINGENCESEETKMELEKEEATSDCDIVNSVPEDSSKVSCDTQTESANFATNHKDLLDCKDKDSNKEQISEEKQTSNSRGNSSKELLMFNEDLVCEHNLLSPKASTCRIPKPLASEIMHLCHDAIHPAIHQDDFSSCPDCGAKLDEFVRACDIGRQQKKQLMNLFQEKKRPHPMRDPNKNFFAISRDFIIDWKSYIRSCERGDADILPLIELSNSTLLCSHSKLLFPVFALQPHQLTEHLVLAWEEEWEVLKGLYPPDHVIRANYTDGGILVTDPGVCEEGCVEVRAAQDYEDQFSYECEIIHVRQVNSVNDIPRRTSRSRQNPSCLAAAAGQAALMNENLGPRKKPRLAATTSAGSLNTTSTTSSHRLVRASKTFSSTDTIREVQNFIADRTGIWPMLQTLWVCKSEDDDDDAPMQLTDDHRTMTLNALRVKPGDTIYFRAAMEDMELAAGDGVVEFNEMDLE